MNFDPSSRRDDKPDSGWPRHSWGCFWSQGADEQLQTDTEDSFQATKLTTLLNILQGRVCPQNDEKRGWIDTGYVLCSIIDE